MHHIILCSLSLLYICVNTLWSYEFRYKWYNQQRIKNWIGSCSLFRSHKLWFKIHNSQLILDNSSTSLTSCTFCNTKRMMFCICSKPDLVRKNSNEGSSWLKITLNAFRVLDRVMGHFSSDRWLFGFIHPGGCTILCSVSIQQHIPFENHYEFILLNLVLLRVILSFFFLYLLVLSSVNLVK